MFLDEPLPKIVVYLPPDEYKSTWVGNKAVYRTCLALAEGAELLSSRPGVVEFGEDPAIDALIRTYGYRGKTQLIEAVERREDLQVEPGRRRGPDQRLGQRPLLDHLLHERPGRREGAHPARGRGCRLPVLPPWRPPSRGTIPA